MTRDDIIKAAFKVWGREFYQATSLTDLARELKVCKAAFYRHFRNKEALIDTMNTVFFDEYTTFIKNDYEKALASGNLGESCHIMIRSVSEYFIRNEDAFIFQLFQVFGSRQIDRIPAQMVSRGIDFDALARQVSVQDAAPFQLMVRLVMISLCFWVGQFHHNDLKPDQPSRKSKALPSDEVILSLATAIDDRICRGVGLPAEDIAALDYARLEEKAAMTLPEVTEDNRLLKAVAAVVAEEGPWHASMEMVARRSGLAKSSLYSHFKNKQDMLDRLFITEFANIASYADRNSKTSLVPGEQLYLVLVSIATYLQSRPEILVAMNWFRTQRPKPPSQKPDILPDIFRIITDIDLPALREAGDKKESFAQWILFLIMKSLIWQPEIENVSPQDLRCFNTAGTSPENLRMLYRFIALGLKGFI